ncbi:hypothetical protein [Acinetobacter soli]|uniref:hypothetical protein n=1 Tax=Acinetobacter soli TaxID=487316 RepID=UPI000DCFD1E2|nr:hypothetical protein [Acinetobacter soli]
MLEKKPEFLAEINSLRVDRIEGVKRLIEQLIIGNLSTCSINSLYKEINTVFTYLNKNFPKVDFRELSKAEEVYCTYSKFLINTIHSKKAKNGSVNTEHYKLKQSVLANFLAACTDKSTDYYYSKFRKIEYIRTKNPIDIKMENININDKVRILADIFNILSNHLLNNSEFPCIIDLRHHGLNINYIDLNFKNKSNDEFLNIFYNNNEINSIEVFEKKIHELTKGDSTRKRDLRKKYHYRKEKILELNKMSFKDCKTKILMANFCILTFAKLLISVSGANESTLYGLKIENFSTINNQKGKRSYGIKKRAGYKNVAIEFGLKFKVFFDKYLKLRKKINDEFFEEIPKDLINLLFIKIPIQVKSSYKKFMELDTVTFDMYNSLYKKMFNESVVTNKELRNNVANSYFNTTNSSIITSMKLGNTPDVTNTSYANASFTEVSDQISSFFYRIDEEIILRGRKHSNLIPIKIESENAISTPIGNCLSQKPQLIEDFNELTASPTCNNPKSCLYCKSFTLHLNKLDIKKLLSLKFILEYSPQIKNEKIRLIYRINEIIDYIKINYPFTKQLILEISNEVNEGYLDAYWDNHLTMLVDIEDITYDQ